MMQGECVPGRGDSECNRRVFWGRERARRGGGAEVTEVKRGEGRDKKDCWVGAQACEHWRLRAEAYWPPRVTPRERNRRLSRRAAVKASPRGEGPALHQLEVVQGRGLQKGPRKQQTGRPEEVGSLAESRKQAESR